MLSKRVGLIVAAFAATFSVLTAVGAKAAPSPYSWAAGLPGCDTSQPAVAHYANQKVLSPQPEDGPVPCGTSTGWPTVETRIEVTNDAVIQEPALLSAYPVLGGCGHAAGLCGQGEGLARTFDNGGKWSAVSVQVPPDTQVFDGGVDNNLYVDHITNRLFFYMMSSGGPATYAGPAKCAVPGGTPATVAFTDNDGTTWNWGYDIDHGCSENPTVLTAKPTVSDLAHSSYPDVVYLCGDNTSTGAGGTGNPGFSCSKSLDGGAHWLGSELQGTLPLQGQGFYSGPVKDATAPYKQCNGQSSSAGADVQPLPNGDLVVLVSCNSSYFLSESKDEGATWNIVHQVPASVSGTSSGLVGGPDLRIDSAGNMYVLNAVNTTTNVTPSLPGASSSNGSSKLLLSHSTDGGATWSTPLNMVAPGVTSVGTYNFAQGTFDDGLVGNIAVTYYGINPKSPDGKNGYSDGYITATRDALEPNPVFWSGQVNPNGHPLLYNTPTDGNIGITVLDFNGGAWSPNGQSVWGSWVQDCGSNIATSPGCTSRYPAINPADPDNGFAGRLVWPPGERTR